MSRGRDLVETPADEIRHSKCLQAMFCEEGKWQKENLRFSEKRGPKSQRKRELKHHEDSFV